MIAFIPTITDHLRGIALILSVTFLIPILSGILARILVSQTLGASALAVLISTFACGTLFYRLDLLREEVAPASLILYIPMAAVAIVAVTATASFYSAFANARSATTTSSAKQATEK